MNSGTVLTGTVGCLNSPLREVTNCSPVTVSMTIPPRVRIFAANFYDPSVRAFQLLKLVGPAYLGLAGPISKLVSKHIFIRWARLASRQRPPGVWSVHVRPDRYAHLCRLACRLAVRGFLPQGPRACWRLLFGNN